MHVLTSSYYITNLHSSSYDLFVLCYLLLAPSLLKPCPLHRSTAHLFTLHACTHLAVPETRARAANSGGVVPLPDSCLLPCTVVYVGRAAWFRNVVYLNVHWEARLANDDTFHSLLATNYWHQRDEPLGFSVPYSHCRRHPDSGNDTLVADCSLHLGSCSERLEDLRKFVGDYRCYVRHVLTGYSASVTSRLEGEWTG